MLPFFSGVNVFMQTTERRNVNHFYLIGKLVEQPEKSMSANGLKIVRFKVAVAKSIKEPTGETELYELTGFNQLAEEEYEIGKTMCFSGKLSANNYTNESVTRYNSRLLVNSIATLA